MQAMRIRWGAVDPLEFMFLVVIGLASLGQLLGRTEPGTISQLLPPAWRMLWLAFLCIGSILAIAGIVWPRDVVDGILLEKIGLVSVSFGLLVFALSIATIVLSTGLPLGALMGAFTTMMMAVAFAVKARRIQRVVNELKG